MQTIIKRKKLSSFDEYCPACATAGGKLITQGLQDTEDRTPGQYGLARCPNCALIYLTPQPDPAKLEQLYPHDYHAHATGRDRARLINFLYKMRDRMRWRWVKEHLPNIGPFTLLEIGCGNASLLRAAAEQSDPKAKFFGTEWNFDAAMAGSAIDSRIELARETKLLPISPGSLDLIVLFESLEHMPNTKQLLAELLPLLRPGGRVLGTVPNFQSWGRSLFGQFWAGMQIPRHQVFFEPKSLCNVFAQNGYKKLELRQSFDPGEFGVSLAIAITNALDLRTKPRASWFYLPLILTMSPWQFLIEKISRRTGTIAFVFEKPLTVENANNRSRESR